MSEFPHQPELDVEEPESEIDLYHRELLAAIIAEIKQNAVDAPIGEREVLFDFCDQVFPRFVYGDNKVPDLVYDIAFKKPKKRVTMRRRNYIFDTEKFDVTKYVNFKTFFETLRLKNNPMVEAVVKDATAKEAAKLNLELLSNKTRKNWLQRLKVKSDTGKAEQGVAYSIDSATNQILDLEKKIQGLELFKASNEE